MSKNNNQWYIERNEEGKYTATKGGADRASAVRDAQADAIDRAEKSILRRPAMWSACAIPIEGREISGASCKAQMNSFTLVTRIAQLAEGAKREHESLSVQGPQMQPDGTVVVDVSYRGMGPPEYIHWQGSWESVLEGIGALLEARRSRIEGEDKA